MKKHIEAIKDENDELKRSLEFTQSTVDELKRELHDVRTSVRRSIEDTPSTANISERLRIIEDGKRKKNLRITGLVEDVNENREQTQEKVRKLLSDKLQTNNVNICDVYRIGKPNGVGDQSRPRPVIAKLNTFTEKMSCLKSSHRLAGTSVYISEDVSKATQDIRMSKIEELKRKRSEGLIA